MSTSYIPLKDVLVSDLFDGRLEQFKIHESRSEETTETDRCMTDGENYVWVNVDASGCVVEFVRYGSNSPRKILNTVGDLFQTEIISEHEPQYHGFESEEEWHAYEQSLNKQQDDKFYVEILKFLGRGMHDYAPGSGGMIMLEVAKALVQKDPSLRLPRCKDMLLQKIESCLSRFYQPEIRVTNPQDIPLAITKMIAADEVDLPRQKNAVGDVFQTEIEQRYGGFDTEEEWIASLEKVIEEAEDDHLQLLRFCRGEAHNIRPGTGTMVKAKIAKTLVDQDPSLLLPVNKDKLRGKVLVIWLYVTSKVSYNRLVFMTMNRSGDSTELADTIRNAITECTPILQAIQGG